MAVAAGALHHLALALADAVARDIVIAEDGSLVAIVKGQVLAPKIDSIRLTSSSINGEGCSTAIIGRRRPCSAAG